MVIVMFYLYESAIDTVLTNHKKFVNTENKFSRNRKFEFQDIIKFFLFNKGSSNQDDLDDFLEDKFDEVDLELTRQIFHSSEHLSIHLFLKKLAKNT